MEGSKEETTTIAGCLVRVFGVMVGPSLTLITGFAAFMNEGTPRTVFIVAAGILGLLTAVALLLDRRSARRPEKPPEERPL